MSGCDRLAADPADDYVAVFATNPSVLSMYASLDDATAIYARACRAWYGKRAPRIVKKRIEELKRAGDAKGVEAWTQVADKLIALQHQQQQVA
jgi:hypothetical protein